MLDLLPSRKVTRFLPRAEEVVVELDGSMARKRATRDMWVGRVQMWSINTLISKLVNCCFDQDAESSFPRNLGETILSRIER